MPEFTNPFIGITPGRHLTHNELLRAIRLSLSAEEEAIHIYEAIADASTNELANAVLRDIAKEERVHKGEFQKLIELLAPEETEFMAEGAAEVLELFEKLNVTQKSEPNDANGEQILTVGNLKNQS
jgi:rubrerythrin